MEWINWGGKRRPISFGTLMGMLYEEHFKRSFQYDFFNLSLVAALEEVTDPEVIRAELEGKTNITTLVNIVFCTLLAGCVREGQDALTEGVTPHRVALWMDENQDLTARVFQHIYKAFPPPEKDAAGDETAKKKKVARRMA